VRSVTYGDTRPQPATHLQRLRDDLSRALAEAATEVAVDFLAVEGDAVAVIAHLAAERDCDLIVMANDAADAGLARWLFRANHEKLLAATNCPVLLVKACDEACGAARNPAA
jgi:nucleotide-binding universal stress UspA family protein